jgi:hypothetical protein
MQKARNRLLSRNCVHPVEEIGLARLLRQGSSIGRVALNKRGVYLLTQRKLAHDDRLQAGLEQRLLYQIAGQRIGQLSQAYALCGLKSKVDRCSRYTRDSLSNVALKHEKLPERCHP